MNCLFCKIASGEISANIIHSDDTIVAFDDIHPQAPIHKIIIPRQHISTLNDLPEGDNIVSKMVQSAVKVAKELGLEDDGYRLVMNCNSHGGQTVFHIHLHLLGGRRMVWPPG